MSNSINEPSNIFQLDQIRNLGGLNSIVFQVEMGSTNDVALELLRQDSLKLPALVLTESQRAGRGRGENTWITSQGALTFSLVLDAGFVPQPTLLSLATGYSIVKMIESNTSLSAQLKWPNDVLLSGKKVAGILIESNPHGVVVGIGININNQPALDSATSLSEELENPLELQQALSSMLNSFFDVLDQVKHDSVQLIQSCENCLAFLNEEIELASGAQQLTGRLLGLDANGGLKLKTETGIENVISATHVRRLSPG